MSRIARFLVQPRSINRFAVSFFLMAICLMAASLYAWRHNAYHALASKLILWPGSKPFADWAAIAPWVNCSHQGVDVYVENACCLPFMYGPPLLWLPPLPQTDLSNYLFGCSFIALFSLSLAILPAPRSVLELSMRLAACLSSGVALALERANIDVIIFVAVLAALALARGRFPARLGGHALLLLAACVKFYPIAALLIIVRERKAVFLAEALFILGLVAAYALYYFDELRLVFSHVPVVEEYTMQFSSSDLPTFLLGRAKGAGSFDASLLDPNNTGTADIRLLATRLGLVLLMGLAAIPLMRRYAAELHRLASTPHYLYMTACSSIVLFCFLTSQNFLYRGIFLLPVLAGFLELFRITESVRKRAEILLVSGLILFVLSITLIGQMALQLGAAPGTGLSLALRLSYHSAWWLLAVAMTAVLMHFVIHSASIGADIATWISRRFPSRTLPA